MDLSALIFVALAVAWAVYLVPKALRHHEVDRASRSVESFSDRLRVLARREPVTADRAELVVEGRGGRTSTATAEPTAPASEPASDDAADDPAADDATSGAAERTDAADDPNDPDDPAPHTPLAVPRAGNLRAAAARAARRRRRVLGLVLLVLAAVTGLAVAGVVAWPWVAAPGALLAGWLVACRLTVRQERATRTGATRTVRKRRTTLADQALAEENRTDGTAGTATTDDGSDPADDTAAAEQHPGGWDPVPVTLPTYVAKAPAGRTVRTIDLDSTGVWSSGRSESDSALAREAERAAATSAEPAAQRRVSGA